MLTPHNTISGSGTLSYTPRWQQRVLNILCLALFFTAGMAIAEDRPTRSPIESRGVLDVRVDCGARGDGVTDDTAAIQRCIDRVRALGSSDLHSGGSLHFPRPAVHYVVKATLNFDNTYGIKIFGDQHGIGGNPPHGSSGLRAATLMFYQGGSGNLISAQSSSGFTVEGMVIAYNNPSFTGVVINLNGGKGWETGHARIRDTHISGDECIGSDGCVATSARALISLADSIHVTIDGCYFMWARAGIRMKDTPGAYTYNVSVSNSTFIRLADGAILDPGQLTTIRNCNFEPGGVDAAGVAIAANPTGIYVTPGNFTVGPVLIESCFFGDGSGTGDVRPWIAFDGYNLQISNSFFSTAGPTMEIIGISPIAGTNQNILLTSNYFQGSADPGAAIIRKHGQGTLNVFTAINNFNPNTPHFFEVEEGVVLTQTFIPEVQ